jgi:hypothetical protein
MDDALSVTECQCCCGVLLSIVLVILLHLLCCSDVVGYNPHAAMSIAAFGVAVVGPSCFASEMSERLCCVRECDWMDSASV